MKKTKKTRLCWAREGQKVQCIDPAFGLYYGRVYLVTKIVWASGFYKNRSVTDWGLVVDEVENSTHPEAAFCIRRFRPLYSSRKSDIAVFHDLLQPTRVEVS